MSLPRITVCGTQGRWSVFVPGYGEVGIVPDLWRAGGLTHVDPKLTPDGLPKFARKTEELVKLIRETGLVVTAEFELSGDPMDDDTIWKRGEYCRLWRIADVVFDGTGLSFRYLEELADLGKKNKWLVKRKRTRRGVGSY
jgi:hypothetical protein